MVARLAAVAALVLAIAACAPRAGPAPTAGGEPAPTRLVVGFSEIYEGELPLWYAQETGVFRKNGLDVDLRYTESATGIAALLAGEIQIYQGGGSQVLSAVSGGADLVVFGNLVPVYPYVFMAPANVKTAEDLRGKKVGVSQPGSTSDVATRVALPKVGLDPDKDVTIVAVGSSQNRTAALMNGSIQGGLDQPPGSFLLEANGFHVLFDMAALKLPVVNNGMSAQRGWLQAHRDVVQRYVDSIVQAIVMLKQDKSRAVAVLKKNLQVDDERALSATYDYAAQLFPDLPYARPMHFADSIAVLGAKNERLRGFDVTKILDDSFIKSAADRGLARP